MFEKLIPVVAPVFICAAIGYAWARSGRPFDAEMVTRLSTNIGVPALVFATLVDAGIDLAALGRMAWATTAVTALFGAVGAVALMAARIPLRSFLPAMMFPNVGNMGLPLALLGFGEGGLALAITFFTVSVVIQLTAGVAISSGTMSPRDFMRVPVLYAVAAALAFVGAGMAPPLWLLNTAKTLGAMTVPLMLLMLGVALAGLRLSNIPRAVGLTSLRFAMGLGGGLAVAWALGLDGHERAILVMQSAMPVAVFNFLFAQRYNTDPVEVAGLVMLSTLFGFAALPFLLGALM